MDLERGVRIRAESFGYLAYVGDRDHFFAVDEVGARVIDAAQLGVPIEPGDEPVARVLARYGILADPDDELAYHHGVSLIGDFAGVPPIDRPLVVNCFATAECPLRCRYCYADDLMRHERAGARDDDVDRVAAMAEAVPALVAVITGGEPLARPDRTARLIARLAGDQKGIGERLREERPVAEARLARETGELRAAGIAGETGEPWAARLAGDARPARETGETRGARFAEEVRPAWEIEEAGEAPAARLAGEARPAGETGETRGARFAGEVRPAGETGETRGARFAGEARPAGETGETRPARFAGEVRPAGETGETRPARFAREARPARETGEAPAAGPAGETRGAGLAKQTRPAWETAETGKPGETRPARPAWATRERREAAPADGDGRKALVLDTSGAGDLAPLLQVLVDARVHLRVSLDSFDRTLNDRLRPARGRPADARVTLAEARAAGVPTTVQTVVTSANDDRDALRRMRDQLMAAGVRNWVLHGLVPAGKAAGAAGRALRPGPSTRETLADLVRDSTMAELPINIRVTANDGPGNSALIIGSKGDLYIEHDERGKIRVAGPGDPADRVLAACRRHISPAGHAGRYLNGSIQAYGSGLVAKMLPTPAAAPARPSGERPRSTGDERRSREREQAPGR